MSSIYTTRYKRNRIYSYLIIACIIGYTWLFYIFFSSDHRGSEGFTPCIFKNVTSIPCPSCGSTRSVISLLQFDFVEALYWNPIGLILAAILIVLPIWILYDLVLKKSSIPDLYYKFENQKRKALFISILASLMIANWIWNIIKDV